MIQYLWEDESNQFLLTTKYYKFGQGQTEQYSFIWFSLVTLFQKVNILQNNLLSFREQLQWCQKFFEFSLEYLRIQFFFQAFQISLFLMEGSNHKSKYPAKFLYLKVGYIHFQQLYVGSYSRLLLMVWLIHHNLYYWNYHPNHRLFIFSNQAYEAV